jgi:hypothetical protein
MDRALLEAGGGVGVGDDGDAELENALKQFSGGLARNSSGGGTGGHEGTTDVWRVVGS